jgi:hypothetical protein
MKWKDVPGYEGLYIVSENGDVKSLKRTCGTKGGSTRTVSEKILFPNLDAYGYKRAKIMRDGKGKIVKVHRLVALCFIGPSDLCVNHRDLNKQNNHYSNLEYTTLKENCLHARRNKPWIAPSGAGHYAYNLTPEIERQIRSLRAGGMLLKDIAATTDISERNVRNVIHRQGRFKL